MDAEESELAGALVGHSVDAFKAGESVVLTLADERVLVEEGNVYTINDKEEMLENVNMVRTPPAARRPPSAGTRQYASAATLPGKRLQLAALSPRAAARRAPRLSQPPPPSHPPPPPPSPSACSTLLAPPAQAEDWRRQHGKELASGGKYNLYGDNSNILGKYDEDAGRTTVTLDGAGTVDEAKLKKLAAIKQRLQAAAAGGGGVTTSYDLSTATIATAPGFSMSEDYQVRGY